MSARAFFCWIIMTVLCQNNYCIGSTLSTSKPSFGRRIKKENIIVHNFKISKFLIGQRVHTEYIQPSYQHPVVHFVLFVLWQRVTMYNVQDKVQLTIITAHHITRSVIIWSISWFYLIAKNSNIEHMLIKGFRLWLAWSCSTLF